ncbi:DUF6406 domain-containing protein [Actinomadura fibrosa]|uniref:DUF6406 domain-containing protein n=1 Tax=Actinomadura fibrosa TaxID=111802 RepID=A0ABW2Y2H4_9ACTN|nr:DUF6406 domain-containing protein [Actinomadura fibrosa]
MTTRLTEILLRPNRQRNSGIGSFAALHVYAPGGDTVPEVRLMVVTDEERVHVLHPGETFPVGEQTWKLDRIDTVPGSGEPGRDWEVVLTAIA